MANSQQGVVEFSISLELLDYGPIFLCLLDSLYVKPGAKQVCNYYLLHRVSDEE